MADEYIVLRAENLMLPETGALGAPAMAPAAPTAAAGTRVEISSVELTKKERDDLRRDPRTQAIARAMPLSLIAPTSTAAATPSAGQSTWGVEAVGAAASAFDGAGIRVAVLDTGIEPTHPAFAGVNLIRRNFTTEGDDDSHGHGTHCAGTIFGRDVGGMRIGVATGVTDAMIGKVLGAGGGSSRDLVEAIQWAVSQGAHVISMSLGIDFPGFVAQLQQGGLQVQPATSIALEQYRANVNLFSRLADLLGTMAAFQQASIVVAASGNESRRPTYEIAAAPPSAGSGIMAVGALSEGSGAGFEVALFSNTQCNLSAPGVDVVSAGLGGGLATMSGTSMATPHVAGIAALWAQQQVQAFGQVRDSVLTGQLLGNARRDLCAPGSEREDVGEGIVQAP